MARIAFLECSQCGHKVAADSSTGLCPLDAGLLSVRYDMASLRLAARREQPAELAAAALADQGRSLGLWRYADLLPDAVPLSLGEGWTPLVPSRKHEGLFVKDEGTNPTGSVHARSMAVAVSMAMQAGARHVAMSAGREEANALAAYAAAAQLGAHVFTPRRGSVAGCLELLLCGAQVTWVEGLLPECDRTLAETLQGQKNSGVRQQDAWVDVSARQGTYGVEGAKTLGYELVEQLGWKYPDAILYPDEGVGLLGLCKAFEEMEQLGWVEGTRPRVYAFETSHRAAVAEIVRVSGGRLLAVSDEEWAAALSSWATGEGRLLCPMGAAGAAGYTKLAAAGEILPGERVVLINPAAGIRYAEDVAKAVHLRLPGSLPTSLPIGGIITPV